MIHDSIIRHYPDMKIMFNGHSVPSDAPSGFLDFADDHCYKKDLSHLYQKYDSIDPACRKICIAEYATSVSGPVPVLSTAVIGTNKIE